MNVGRLKLAIGAATVLAAIFSGTVDAGESVPTDLTFRASAGGGTLSVTTTTDMTGVLRIELEDVAFEPNVADECGATVSAVRFFDPPQAVMPDQSFSASLLVVGATPGLLDSVSLSGAVESETALEGTARYLAGVKEQFCMSEALVWSAAGPVDTPPGPDDLFFVGSPLDGSGTITVTMAAQRTGVSSVSLDAVSWECVSAGDPLDVRDFFEPPRAPEPDTDEFRLQLAISRFPNFAGVTLTVATVSKTELTGRFEYLQISPYCTSEGTWSAQLVIPPAQPTPTGAVTAATPSPGSSPTPDPGLGTNPARLPATGRPAASRDVSASLALAATGALTLAGAALISRRS